MRAMIWSGLLVALSLGVATPSQAACDPVGEIRFICDVIGPEDLAIVPGSEWVIASGNQEGGRIHLVSQTLSVERIFQHPRIEGFTLATTGIQIGEEIWLGTNSGEMIAYFPVPR